MSEEKKIRRTTERRFIPTLPLQRAAEHHLEAANKSEHGRYYNLLSAILFSALSIEAIANTYGDLLFDNWAEDFEICRPKAKLRLIAERCGIKTDFGKAPWQTAGRLIEFRNGIAHPKPKRFVSTSTETAAGFAVLKDKIEQVDFGFASQALESVKQIQKLLNATLNEGQLHAVSWDGHLFSATIDS